jgi:hypothetical protein
MFVPQERLQKRPFGRAKQVNPAVIQKFRPVGEPSLLTFQDYTTGRNHTGIVSIYNFNTSNCFYCSTNLCFHGCYIIQRLSEMGERFAPYTAVLFIFC